MSRCISVERPSFLMPSRFFLSPVELGSMAYSAVSQPIPVFFKKGMAPSSSKAVHSTRVSPQLMSTEPPLVLVKSGISSTGRSSAAPLPSKRLKSSIFPLLSGPVPCFSLY